LAYSQGFTMLQGAAGEFSWDLDMTRIAEIWRAGCIIRSALLDDIAAAYRVGLPSESLFLAPSFAAVLNECLPSLRKLVAYGALAGLPIPAFAASLSYIETMRRARGTANLLQAQRDFFGAHGFERTDQKGGDFHGPWAM
jgi:6-phosphogluconate dehydrogenase